ncbi:MAG: hypothetical protein CMJ27_06370 [Phycisphaerae bacterium]|nr:hypothetical protein [Phycisphaerae bacterium]MAH66000.1 hypothetical protein [Phycisphaerae bacterium]OUX01614.1 MAG: hypothetical protein CBD91_04175 [Phycisphaeraceae bacterium TMED231]OUX02660.1 MAG: hypothetical protein CBD91_01950 [Phycisphaeraceae bacterium TMED231]
MTTHVDRLWRLRTTAIPVLTLFLVAAVAPAAIHPQDGPHVDVRISIDESAVVVRLEMNLVFLDHIVDFPREDPARISTVEWPALQPLLLDFFTRRHPLRIDGRVTAPSVEGLQINDPDLALLPLFPISGERGLRKIRFELEYPTDGKPSTVELSWTTFPPDILTDPVDPPPLDIAAELDAEGVRQPLLFSGDRPGVTWKAMGESIDARLLEVPASPVDPPTAIPMLAIVLFVTGGVVVLAGVVMSRSSGAPGPFAASIVLEGLLLLGGVAVLLTDVGTIEIGGGPRAPDAAEAEAIFRPLHANVYRAFDYVEEWDIYDALDRSVEGPFLQKLYRTIFQGLVMQEEGGAVARVSDVRPIDIRVGDIRREDGDDGVVRSAFDVECRWQVEGVVSHWGHSHRRINEYVAEWDVVDGPNGWRLVDARITEQDRVDPDAKGDFGVGDEFEL